MYVLLAATLSLSLSRLLLFHYFLLLLKPGIFYISTSSSTYYVLFCHFFFFFYVISLTSSHSFLVSLISPFSPCKRKKKMNMSPAFSFPTLPVSHFTFHFNSTLGQGKLSAPVLMIGLVCLSVSRNLTLFSCFRQNFRHQ